jgi:hypothetical protein
MRVRDEEGCWRATIEYRARQGHVAKGESSLEVWSLAANARRAKAQNGAQDREF